MLNGELVWCFGCFQSRMTWNGGGLPNFMNFMKSQLKIGWNKDFLLYTYLKYDNNCGECQQAQHTHNQSYVILQWFQLFKVLNYYSEPSSVVILFLSFYFPQFLSWSMSVLHFPPHPRKYAKLYILGELFQFFQLASSMTTFIPWPFMSDIANVIVIDIWKLLGSINILHISLWKCNLLMLYCLIGGFIQTHYSSKS